MGGVHTDGRVSGGCGDVRLTLVMMIGGRHSGGDPPVSLVVNLDEHQVATMVVRPGFFLDFVDVPAAALAGEGRYAKLTVSARASGYDAAGCDRAVQPAVTRHRPVRLRRGVARARVQPADGAIVALDERARRRQGASRRTQRRDADEWGVTASLLRPGAADSRQRGRPRALGARAHRRLHRRGRDSRRRPRRRQRAHRPDVGSQLRRRREGRHGRQAQAGGYGCMGLRWRGNSRQSSVDQSCSRQSESTISVDSPSRQS